MKFCAAVVFLLMLLTGCSDSGSSSSSSSAVSVLSDAESVEQAIAALTFNDFKGSNTLESEIRSDLLPPLTGLNDTTISWSSSNTAYIADSGAVTRPAFGSDDVNVTYTATVTKNSVSDTKSFALTVLAQSATLTQQPLLIIRLEFSNHTFVSSAATWASKIFGYSGGELNDYFDEVSYGQYAFVPANESQGTANDGIVTVQLAETHPGDVNDFVTRLVSAANLADAYIDYAAYDTDGDGAIESDELQVMFLVAGGESATGAAPGIWAHAWCLYGQYGADAPTLDGVKVMDCASGGGYSRFGERHFWSHDATIGIIAHELGHAAFSLPDLYDTDYSSEGIGSFGLMGGGSWAYQSADEDYGATPVHMSAWSKLQNGWISPTTVSVSTNNIALAGTDSGSYNVLRIVTGNTGEYFLIENRAAGGYDRGLFALDYATYEGGMAIWHIDENQAGNTDETHKLVDIEDANDPELDSGAGWGTRTNLYYAGNKTDFTPATTPNSRRYDNTNDGISVTNISAAGATMYLDVALP